MAGFFLWGRGGRRMTPEDIAFERRLAANQQQGDYSPIQSPWQGLARVAGNLNGALRERSADRASEANADETRSVLEALMAGGTAPAAPSPADPVATALAGASAGVLPSTGRPMLPNADGSVSTEESITITDPRINNGAPTNIPSIWNGQRYADEGDAVAQALASGQQFQSFPNIDEAVNAARARSEMLGREVDSVRNGAVTSSAAPAPSGVPAPPGGANNAAIIAALANPYVSDQVRQVAGMQYRASLEAANRRPVQPHYWETNNGSLGIVGEDGVPRILYQDPTPRTEWISARNPDGTLTIVPMQQGGGAPGQAGPPDTLPPDFQFPDEQGGPTPAASGGFPGVW